MVHKNDLEQGNRTMSPLERELWHGTTAEAIDNIYTKGLDRSYSGANGNNTYFIHIIHIRQIHINGY